MTDDRITVEIHADVSGFHAALGQASRAAHRLSIAWMSRSSRRRHLARCDLCSPMANPARLSIDGHAYARRTRNRRKRR